MFGCVLENTIEKHIFYLLLTFSYIFLVTKRLYNIIYSSKHKQNPEKNHQIRTNEGEIAIGAVGASRDASIAIARRSKWRSRSRSALPRQPVMSAARCVDRNRGKLRSPSAIRAIARRSKRRSRYRASWWCQRTVMSRSILSVCLSVSLSLSLSLSLFYFPRPKVLWSENRNGKSFPLFWLSNSVNWKCFSVWPNLK